MTRTIRQKIYLRDSGLLHALLGIETADDLYGHPVVVAAWEGFVIEQLIGCIGDPSVDSSFYRTVAGAEIDLIFSLSAGKQALEMKLGLSPSLSKGYHLALADLSIEVGTVVYSGAEGYQMAGDAGVSNGSHEEFSLASSRSGWLNARGVTQMEQCETLRRGSRQA